MKNLWKEFVNFFTQNNERTAINALFVKNNRLQTRLGGIYVCIGVSKVDGYAVMLSEHTGEVIVVDFMTPAGTLRKCVLNDWRLA